MVILKCTKKECGYKWNYTGKSKFYASCPRCKTPIKILYKKVKKVQQDALNHENKDIELSAEQGKSGVRNEK